MTGRHLIHSRMLMLHMTRSQAQGKASCSNCIKVMTHHQTLIDFDLSYICRKWKKSACTFELESLPPTSAAAKFHAYRAYFAVQEWLGNVNNLQPTDWGWKYENKLIPICTDRPVAPDHILRMVSCGCKTGCGKKCKCRKTGLNCSEMCSSCTGITCNNAYPLDDSDDNNNEFHY